MIVIKNQFLFPPIGWLPIEMRSNPPALGQKIIERLRTKDRVWVSSVAQRIHEQASDAQCFAEGQTKVRNARSVPVLIVGSRVISVDPAGPDGIIEDVDLS